MNIVTFRVHNMNIGEGIVTKGAVGCIKQAFPNSNVIDVSLYPDKIVKKIQNGSFASSMKSLLGISSDVERFISNTNSHTRITELLDIDLAIIPGGILRHGIDQFLTTFRLLRQRGIPIILLGVGGNGDSHFSSNNLDNLVTDVFDDLEINHLITRNELAYDAYKDKVSYAYNGIDCGFFIDDWRVPPESREEFSAVTLDHGTQDLTVEGKVIYPHHTPFDNPHRSLHKRIYYKILHGIDTTKINVGNELVNKNGSYVSDNITDYLFLYRNAQTTYSDRIHACVPTLAYGGQAQLYVDDLRKHIFDGLVSGDITNETVKINKKEIKKRKKEQVKILQDYVESLSI